MIRTFLLVLVLGTVADHVMFDGHFTNVARQIVGQILVHTR
jgi:hypothetical protein